MTLIEKFCGKSGTLWAVLLCALLLQLGGCGAKGDLYLPQDTEQQQK